MILLNVLLQVITQDTPAAAGESKFYAVIAVVAALFAGITAYLVSIDKKLKKLEDK